jgi:prephenate dehydrogenase
MKKTIGLIGFGRFGRLIVKYLSKRFKIIVYDKKNIGDEIIKLGGMPGNLIDACGSDIIIPAVPISEFESVLIEIKPFLKKGSTLVDVCSVKEYPASLMKKTLPDNVNILATHPMFGPDSASETLSKRKIILCKVRIDDERYGKIKSFLESLGLIVIETTPETHDEDMANSLLLTHFIGRSLIDFGAKDQETDTEGYKRLMKILETVQNDSWQLFYDMNKYNKYAKLMRGRFIKSIIKIDKKVKE